MSGDGHTMKTILKKFLEVFLFQLPFLILLIVVLFKLEPNEIYHSELFRIYLPVGSACVTIIGWSIAAYRWISGTTSTIKPKDVLLFLKKIIKKLRESNTFLTILVINLIGLIFLNPHQVKLKFAQRDLIFNMNVEYADSEQIVLDRFDLNEKELNRIENNIYVYLLMLDGFADRKYLDIELLKSVTTDNGFDDFLNLARDGCNVHFKQVTLSMENIKTQKDCLLIRSIPVSFPQNEDYAFLEFIVDKKEEKLLIDSANLYEKAD